MTAFAAAGREPGGAGGLDQRPIAERLGGRSFGGRRNLLDRGMRLIALLAAVVCIAPLAAVLGFVTVNGIGGLNLDLLTKPPKALGIGGGAANAILGTLQMLPLAAVIALPAGILGAVYVAEFGDRRAAAAIRFAADVLVGVPSILVGVFVFTFLVLPFKQ